MTYFPVSLLSANFACESKIDNSIENGCGDIWSRINIDTGL